MNTISEASVSVPLSPVVTSNWLFYQFKTFSKLLRGASGLCSS